MEQASSLTDAINYIAIGHIAISFDDWTDGSEPVITAGSTLEIGGSMFLTPGGDDDIDVAGAWGGIANSTLVYIYYAVSGTTATAELSITAPTWDDEKQGWYDAGLTKRCVGSIYKDSGGNYDLKTIFLSQFHGKTNQGIINPSLEGDLSHPSNLRSAGVYRDTTPTDTYKNVKWLKKEIGNWDMSTATGTGNITVTITGATNNICYMFAMIRDDASIYIGPLNSYDITADDGTMNGGIKYQKEFALSQFKLYRKAGGDFDNANYNATPFNRGWLYVAYEES